MDLTWLGGAATRMRTRTAAVVMDPYDKSAGGTLGRPDAHIITVSHDDPMRNGIAQVAPAEGDPMVLTGPGEYEIRGVIIEGVRSSLRGDGEPVDLRSTLWLFEAEDIRVAHLGGMGAAPSGAAMDVLSVADIVFVPIGLPDTLQGADAAKAVRAMEPSIVIPIGYDPADEAALKAFVSAMAATPEEPVSRFTVNKRDVADDTKRLVLLEARA
ncbi:MAG: MBL fold metallo-hydrolase [Dehalococcoidia bacterium]|nr:MBL fold metallo-hydrolase [Dehalococcoidia bacterium]MCA9850080.1 MBL fold metallo-hydrolase [Dehalococcoidia bacterium]MCA9857129.1 MBL fold metallo-hydrolase [Dehalococcoidia bacterium]MCB9490886.1 MBL fold metallo-hydrolase [Dehalococcoidia bacterium]